MVVTDVQHDLVAALADELGTGHALGVKVDVRSRADIDAAITAAVGRFGRLDLVVNNAAEPGLFALPSRSRPLNTPRPATQTQLTAR